MNKELRLDKFLADMGKGTRSALREAVRKGRVRVNGEVIKKADIKVRIPGDTVTLDGEEVAYAVMEYYMLNKPQGVVSATEDKKYPTVLDLIADKKRKDLFPVGRLDLDTEGLLLITNDGDLAHRLLSPKKHVDKVYYARCRGTVREGAAEEFARGIHLPDGLLCLPAELTVLSYDRIQDESEIRLRIREGKFHQVKRMMEAAGCPVLFLKRLSMGPLVLDETLKPGEYRPLTDTEREWLEQL